MPWWAPVKSVSGQNEEWNSDLYFSTGLSVMYASSAILAYIERERAWRRAVIALRSTGGFHVI